MQGARLDVVGQREPVRLVVGVANRVHEPGCDDEDHQPDLVEAGTELGRQDAGSG